MAKSKFVTIDNKLYFFSYADGSMQKNGFFTKGGKTYYADKSTGEIAIGTKIIDGKEYTFDNNGVLQK